MNAKTALILDFKINLKNTTNISVLDRYKKIYVRSLSLKNQMIDECFFNPRIKTLEYKIDDYDEYLNNYLISIFDDFLPTEIRAISKNLKNNIHITFRKLFLALYLISNLKEKKVDILTSDKSLIKYFNKIDSKFLSVKKLKGSSKKINFYTFFQNHWLEWYIKHFFNLITRPKKTKIIINTKLIENLDCYLYDINNYSVIEKLNYLKSKSKNEKICLISDNRIKDKVADENDFIFRFTDLMSKESYWMLIKKYFKIKKAIKHNSLKTKIRIFCGYDITHIFSLNDLALSLALAETEFHYYKNFIKKFKPKSINTASGIHSRSYLFLLASRDFGIETNTIQHGLPFLRVGYIPAETDKLYYWGCGEKILKNWGVKNIYPIDYLDSKKIYNSSKSINDYILITLHSSDSKNTDILPFMTYLSKKYVQEKFIIRKHPGLSGIPKDLIKVVQLNENVFWDEEVDIFKSIANSKLIITFFSSIIDDARIFGKKLYLIHPFTSIFPEIITNLDNIILVNRPNEIIIT